MAENLILTVGFDEAGRGPLAGPVMAGCVVLPKDFPFEILNDSKKLSEKKRTEAERIIKEKALWGLGIVDHDVIDEINILQASLLAMKLAYEDMLSRKESWLFNQGIPEEEMQNVIFTGITDGTKCPEVPIECRAEPKADGKYPEVMAASIIAKTSRDSYMKNVDKLYPEYGYAKHKGYPTKAHREICHKLGPSPIQRLSFSY